jgi:hypothetical protein
MTLSLSLSAFRSLWRTTLASEVITLPLYASGGTYDFTVVWGDGSPTEACTTATLPCNHTYATADDYTVIDSLFFVCGASVYIL